LSRLAERPIPRGLTTLALVLAAAAITTRGLSSGVGQTSEWPGSVLVLDALGAMAALALLGARFLSQEPALVPDRGVLAPLGLFLGVAFAASVGSPTSEGLRTAYSWTALAAAALAIRDLARRNEIARSLMGLVVGVATAASLLGLYGLFVETPASIKALKEHPELLPELQNPGTAEAVGWRLGDPMATGPYLLPSHLATALGIALPLLLVAAWRARATRSRAFLPLLATALVLGLGIGFARSKGATLACLVALAAFAWLALPRESARLRRGLLALGAGALVLVLGLGAVRVATGRGLGASAEVRLEYWRAALSMAEEKPLTGHGLESFGGEYPRHKSARAEEVQHAHQDVLELLAETGVLGPLAFLWLALALGRNGVRAIRGVPEAPEKRGPELSLRAPVATVLGVAAGALALLAHGFPYDLSTSWHLFFAAVVAIAVGHAVAGALPGDAPDDAPWRPRFAAAALAGALAFLVDGLTDFPLRAHGLVLAALALALAAPALARGSEPPRAAPAPVRLVLGLVVIVVAVLGLARTRGDTAADGQREAARNAFYEAERLLHPIDARGNRVRPTVEDADRGVDLLEHATDQLKALLEARRLPPRDIQLLVTGEDRVGRWEVLPKRLEAARRELREGTRLYPFSYGLQAELGRRLAGISDWTGAIAAYDAAARLAPTDPRARLDAGVVRVERSLAAPAQGGAPLDDADRARAIADLEAALRCALASRLERVHLSREEIAAAQGLLTSLGAAPRVPEAQEPLGR
jgi:tetratricopeptide (TPR) repeat protein